MNNEEKYTDEEEQEGMIFANMKRTYDEYQDLSLTSARRSQENNDQLNNVALQNLSNTVENANLAAKQALESSNMVSKQHMNHRDLFIGGLNKEGTFKDAIRTELVAVLKDLGLSPNG